MLAKTGPPSRCMNLPNSVGSVYSAHISILAVTLPGRYRPYVLYCLRIILPVSRQIPTFPLQTLVQSQRTRFFSVISDTTEVIEALNFARMKYSGWTVEQQLAF